MFQIKCNQVKKKLRPLGCLSLLEECVDLLALSERLQQGGKIQKVARIESITHFIIGIESLQFIAGLQKNLRQKHRVIIRFIPATIDGLSHQSINGFPIFIDRE